MAGRQKWKQERATHLEAIGAQALPLPSEPRTSPISYTPDLCSEAVDLGACGLSDTEIAAHWGVDVQTLGEWQEGHSDLKDALSRARTAAMAWWEEKARRALELRDNRFPAGAWAMVMKARFPDYRDRIEVSGSVDLVHKLVRLDLRVPELLGEQTAGAAKPLTDKAAVRLDASQTASGDLGNEACIEGEARRVERS